VISPGSRARPSLPGVCSRSTAGARPEPGSVTAARVAAYTAGPRSRRYGSSRCRGRSGRRLEPHDLVSSQQRCDDELHRRGRAGGPSRAPRSMAVSATSTPLTRDPSTRASRACSPEPTAAVEHRLDQAAPLGDAQDRRLWAPMSHGTLLSRYASSTTPRSCASIGTPEERELVPIPSSARATSARRGPRAGGAGSGRSGGNAGCPWSGRSRRAPRDAGQ